MFLGEEGNWIWIGGVVSAVKGVNCMLEFDDGEYVVTPFVFVEKFRIYHRMRHICRKRRRGGSGGAVAIATECGNENMCDVSSLSS